MNNTLNGIQNIVNDAMAKKVSLKISGYEAPVIYKELHLNQSLLGHHSFQFNWQVGSGPIVPFKSLADIVRKYMGAKVLIHFKNQSKGLNVYFKGMITEMEMLDADGASKGFLVKGISPDILMDDVAQSRVFENQSLSQIVEQLTQSVPKGMFDGTKVEINNDKNLDYVVQYNETDYQFLQRLAVQHGQWMYYDGELLKFGKLKGYGAVIKSGVNLHEFKIKSKLKPQKLAYSAYDYQAASPSKEQQLSPNSNSTSYFAQNTQKTSNQSFNRTHGYYAYTNRANNGGELSAMQQLAQQGQEASVINYSGRSILPLQIGGSVKIVKDTVESSFIATNLRHYSRGFGHYDCYFEAIPADVQAPPYTNPFVHPKAETQSAKVIDNNDPQGMGRIRVRFAWQQESKWLRMVTPHAGGGKGFYFVPEIGEEVLIAFEGGNPEKPFVLGAHYNGAASSGYNTPKNDQKVIHTRSGTKIIMNDAEGSVFIEDPSGNTWLMDGNGNINVNAPKNISINAGENINISAGQNITSSAGLNLTESAGGMIAQTATLDYTLMATNIMEMASGGRSSKAKKVTENGGEIAKNSSNKDVNVQGKGKIVTNSGEYGTNH